MRRFDMPTWRAMGALALPLLYMLIIYRLSAMPGDSVEIGIAVSDKFLHAVEYGGLSFLLYFALRYGLGTRPNKAAWLSVLVAALYGVTDEWHQSFVPGRDTSIFDWYADCVGALLAQGVLFLWRVGWCKKSLPL